MDIKIPKLISKFGEKKDYKFLEKKIVINDNGSYTFDIKKKIKILNLFKQRCLLDYI